MGSLSTCTVFFRILFSLINFIILLIGLSVLSVGIYLQVEANKLSFIFGRDHIAGPPILIASGLFTSILAAVGFLGACLKSRALLVIYAFVLIVIIILQFAAGILGIVYRETAKDNLEENFNDGLQRAIRKYSNDKGAKNAVEFLQKEFKCCGVEGPSSWGDLNGQVIYENEGNLPESCQCNTSSTDCDIADPFPYEFRENGKDYNETYTSANTVWIKGCNESTTSFFEELANVYGGVGLGFGIFEIIGVVFAIGLVCCISKARGKYEVV